MGGAPPGARLILYTPDVELVAGGDGGTVWVRVREDGGRRLVEASVDAAVLLEALAELSVPARRLFDVLERVVSRAAARARDAARLARGMLEALERREYERFSALLDEAKAKGYQRLFTLVARSDIVAVRERLRGYIEDQEGKAAVLEKLLACIEEARNKLVNSGRR